MRVSRFAARNEPRNRLTHYNMTSIYISFIGLLLLTMLTAVTGKAVSKLLWIRNDKSDRTENTPSDGTIDLADFPLLFDLTKAAIFFEECSKAFPQQRVVRLPLGMVDFFLLPQPQLSEEFRLIKTSRRDDLVILSRRLLSKTNSSLSHLALEYISFQI